MVMSKCIPWPNRIGAGMAVVVGEKVLAGLLQKGFGGFSGRFPEISWVKMWAKAQNQESKETGRALSGRPCPAFSSPQIPLTIKQAA